MLFTHIIYYVRIEFHRGVLPTRISMNDDYKPHIYTLYEILWQHNNIIIKVYINRNHRYSVKCYKIQISLYDFKFLINILF